MKKIYLMMKKGISVSQDVISFLEKKFEIVNNPADSEIIIVCGGDGMMFRASRRYGKLGAPFFGLNYGHIGFLMNKADIQVLNELLADEVEIITQKMLKAILYDKNGKEITTAYAFNDFYFERASLRTVRIRISVNGISFFDPLICDGVVVATAAGSTAYNASAGGIILLVGANSMVLTGICPLIFHHWRTSELAAESKITLEIVDAKRRPAVFVAEGEAIREAIKAEISYSDKIIRLIFAKSENFRGKINRLVERR